MIVDLDEVAPGVWRADGPDTIIDRLIGGRTPLVDEFGDTWPYSEDDVRQSNRFFRRLRRYKKAAKITQTACPTSSARRQKDPPGFWSLVRILFRYRRPRRAVPDVLH